jgi:drug/metabolite transporter (DMT)-like permease
VNAPGRPTPADAALATASPPVIFADRLGEALGQAAGRSVIFAASPVAWPSLAHQVPGIAMVGDVAWFWMVSRNPASRLAPSLFPTPAFAALILGEPPTPALPGAGIPVVNRE